MADADAPAFLLVLCLLGFAVLTVTALLERAGYLRNPYRDD